MGRPRKNAVKKPDTLLDPQEVPEIPLAEQPYPLPKGWKWVYASDIFDIIYGKGLPTKNLMEDGYPVFGANGKIGYYSKYMYSEPKALMSCRGAYSGTMNLSLPFSYVTNNSLIIEGKYHKFTPKFIFLLFSSLDKKSLITGSAQPQVTIQRFNHNPLPLPPENLHGRIVGNIESLFAKLDEAKEQAEAVLDGFETRKAAILHKAFSGELTKIWRSEHGHKREEWQNLTLNDVAKWGSGGTPSRKQPEYYAGNIAWVKTGELNNDYLYETEEHITKDAIKNSSAKIFPKETVIIAMYGATIGQCAILGIDAATNQACACGIVKQNTYNKFLFNYLTSQKNNFINLGKGGAQPNISQTIIKEYPISLPSLPEQKEIVRILDVLISKEQQTRADAETVLEQIELMKKSILARAFRGGLTTVCHYV